VPSLLVPAYSVTPKRLLARSNLRIRAGAALIPLHGQDGRATHGRDAHATAPMPRHRKYGRNLAWGDLL
jgi:hypothetical protein